MSEASAPSEGTDKIQAAGKSLLIYIFSLMKTGEIHDLNNEAWLRPTEKLIDALDDLFKLEKQNITFLVYEGIVQVNSNALWLDKGTLEHVQELEQYLARREAGGIIFTERPDDEVVKQFFFHFARFRAPEGTVDQMGAFQEAVVEEGITDLKLAPQPLRLDTIGQGVRGVASLWYYSKAVAGIEDLMSRRPFSIKDARRLAQDLVDTSSREQDLLVGLALLGEERSIARNAIDTAVLSIAMARGLGMTKNQCADLGLCGILHIVGYGYPNPEPEKFQTDEVGTIFGFRQLLEGARFTPLLAQRVAGAIEWMMGKDGDGQPQLYHPPTPLIPSQLIHAIRRYLDLVRAKGEARKTPLAAGLELLEMTEDVMDPLMVRTLLGTVGLLPVGTVVELQNGDLAVVSEIDHLRGRNLFGQDEPPVGRSRKIFVERMRDSKGKVISERKARIQLGDDSEAGEWAVAKTLSGSGLEDVIVRALIRRPPTVATQLGIR